MRNILILTSSFPKNKNSYEGGFVLELVKRITPEEFSPVVLAPHFYGGKIREYWDNVKIERFVYFLPSYFERLAYYPGILYTVRKDPFAFLSVPLFLLSELLWSWKVIFSRKVSLIHTHWIVPQGLIGAILHALTGIPHVTTIHGSDLTILKKHKLLKYICRFIIRNADVITVNSSYTKQQLVAIAPESVQKIWVIPMGVDVGQFHGIAHSPLEKKYRNNRIILSVGRLIDLKGTIYLIEALPCVLKSQPNTILLLIGSGPEQERLRQRIEDLSLGEHVKFLGTLSHEDLIPYYQTADVFVLPSITRDGKAEALGVVLLEAMASGCPVIGSNVGGVPDIIIDGENGFLVPEQDPDALAERIIQILSDEELKNKFQKNGYNRIIESFTWNQVTNQFLDIYSHVLDPNVPLKTGDAP